jgi:hypothetical protein
MKKRQTKTIVLPMVRPRRRPRKFKQNLPLNRKAVMKAPRRSVADGAGVDAGAAGAAGATVMINPWEN